MRRIVKAALNGAATFVVSPAIALSLIEAALRPNSERLFQLCTHVLAFVPGTAGNFLRRAFYAHTLDGPTGDCALSFGVILSHRQITIEDGVYVGPYAIIGSCHLKAGSLVGSRASILSGSTLHELDAAGRWTPYDASRARKVTIGPHAWVGEGAIVMADVGPRTQVASGAVVSTALPGGVLVAGNPARFVRNLERPGADPDAEAPPADPSAP
jgi:acetyltransferase-like isoleucine patch superfamily enzyme